MCTNLCIHPVIPAKAGTSADYNDIPALGKFAGGPRFRGDDRCFRGDDRCGAGMAGVGRGWQRVVRGPQRIIATFPLWGNFREVPAFAGMTGAFAGMTGAFAGTTGGVRTAGGAAVR